VTSSRPREIRHPECSHSTNPVSNPRSWMGSLVQDAQDASGLMFRRNRYYDPASGRFTQQDPIGLAGGLNGYGFAEGDPVNYDDPYGLSSDPWCAFAALLLCPGAYWGYSYNYTYTAAALGDRRPAEVQFARRHPRAGIRLFTGVRLRADAFGKEIRRRFAGQDADNRQEAARHQFGQCEATRLYGAQIARESGDAHEVGDEHKPDSRRDQRNNAIGRSISARTEGECRRAVEYNIVNGHYSRQEDFQ
jgi:RHS repeat-associated protein